MALARAIAAGYDPRAITVRSARSPLRQRTPATSRCSAWPRVRPEGRQRLPTVRVQAQRSDDFTSRDRTLGPELTHWRGSREHRVRHSDPPRRSHTAAPARSRPDSSRARVPRRGNRGNGCSPRARASRSVVGQLQPVAGNFGAFGECARRGSRRAALRARTLAPARGSHQHDPAHGESGDSTACPARRRSVGARRARRRSSARDSPSALKPRAHAAARQ